MADDPVAGGEGFLAGAFRHAPAEVKVFLAARKRSGENLRDDDQGCPMGASRKQLGAHLRVPMIIW